MSIYEFETELDMAAYYDSTTGHGRSATHISANNTSTVLNIILNNEFLELDEGAGVESTQPMAYFQSTLLPSISYGDQLQVTAYKTVEGLVLSPAINFLIRSIQADRKGNTVLELEAA